MKTRTILLMCILPAILCTAAQAKIIYVDDDANGVNDGSSAAPAASRGRSWQNAYTFLQDALADANSSEKPVEIRIAQGTYKPDRRAGQTAGDRNASFNLIDNVTLSGGYAGLTESEPNEQNIKKYETILSGDLAGDDVKNDNPIISSHSRSENSIHVVTNNKTSILEGFTITRNASSGSYTVNEIHGGAIINDTGNLTLQYCTISGNEAHDYGGGIYNSNGVLNMSDCSILGNSAQYGGGIYNKQGTLNMTNCIFEENSASHLGGGLNNNYGSLDLNSCIFYKNFTRSDDGCGGGLCSTGPTLFHGHKLVNCTFKGNSSYIGGGIFGNGIYNEYDEPFLTNCTFIENKAFNGGGLFHGEGSTVLNTCNFIGNTATNSGGGIFIGSYCHVTLNNCNLCGNQALQNGGGIYHYAARQTTILNNCVLYRNRADNLGGGFYCSGYLDSLVNNTIIWMNTALHGNQIALSAHFSNFSSISLQFSNIQGGSLGIYKEFEENIIIWKDGNIDLDPLFADTGYWDPNGTPDNANDDFWINGDYHLESQAGRFDPNTQTWVQDDVTSPCIDAGDPNSPIGYEPFPNGGRINMGAYGGTSEASKSYFGKPVCTTIAAGDINGDCKVDILDLEIMMSHWLEEH